MRSSIIAASALACAALAACGTDPVAPPLPCTADDFVTLSVAVSPTPRFTWSPPCLVFSLGVADNEGTIVWEIEADSGNALASGVTYGVVPPGVTQTQAPAALLSGAFYAVGLSRRVGTPPSDSVTEVQAIGFRP